MTTTVNYNQFFICVRSPTHFMTLQEQLYKHRLKPHNSTECIDVTIGPNDTKSPLNTFNFFVVLEPSDIGGWLTTRCLASELHPLSLHNW